MIITGNWTEVDRILEKKIETRQRYISISCNSWSGWEEEEGKNINTIAQETKIFIAFDDHLIGALQENLLTLIKRKSINNLIDSQIYGNAAEFMNINYYKIAQPDPH